MLKQQLKPTPASIPFNAAKLATATSALIDLSDPLRTNVKIMVGDKVMYADLVTLQNLPKGKSIAAGKIILAWEKALSGNIHGSNHITLTPEGVLHVNLTAEFRSTGPLDGPRAYLH